MDFAKKGDWVQIENIVLPAGERAPSVPEDTQNCDLKLWVKGVAQSDAKLGETVTVKTATGRVVEGKLVAVNPTYIHTYGEFQPELLKIEQQLKEIMYGGEN
ncbi:MAG: 2-amino-4-ketopentanoate thiolase [Oscillospiraceae bacterium]|nr:2-amino-4-ketopentanoate thiolase [Oscillospiraceae bacterium]